MGNATVIEERRRRGARLKQLREEKGLSARQVARRMAKSEPGSEDYLGEIDRIQRTLRRCENGHNTPRGEFLVELLQALGAEAADLEDDENGHLRERAKEVVAPFQRRDGRGSSGGMPGADRKTGTDGD